MGAIRAIVLAACSVWLFSQPASADKRVALVIGNSAYQKVEPLTNPVGDAAAITAMLKNAQFDVVDSHVDLSVAAMRRALRDFGAKARDSDVAVIFYAGHGVELDGVNYLIPVDAQLETDTDVLDETLALDRVLVTIEPARKLRLIILDACRDNPFSKTMKRTIGTRSISRGLAKVEPSNPNTMIAFAAKAGFTALDGDRKNSPFTLALTDHLTKPGLDLRKAFGFVRDDVLKATNYKQEPFIYGSLGGGDVALVPAPSVEAKPANLTDPTSIMRRDYEFAERVGTKEGWDFFLSTYSDGLYAKLAQAQRNKLAAEEVRLAATEKARLAAEERARLAAEGARATEQAKAKEQARITEEARVASEKRKALEEMRVAAAERAKATAQARAAEDARITAETIRAAEELKAARERLAAEKRKALEEAKVNDDRQIGPTALKTQEEATSNEQPPAAVADIPRLLQTELRRVGCNTGPVNGRWDNLAQKSLELFNKHTGMKLDVRVASLDTLEAVKSRPARTCPLVCDLGYKSEGEACVKIGCPPDLVPNSYGECEKARERAKSSHREADPPASARSGRPEQRPSAEKPAPTGLSCTRMMGKCGAVCAAVTGRPNCVSTVCVRLHASCMSTGCWTGRSYNACGLVKQ
jgi:Caspase domain